MEQTPEVRTEITQDLIIGTGQAGKPLAGALAEAGRRVVIVERDRVGGTCVVRGCTPTKTMVASARVAHLAGRAADYGVRAGSVSVDMEAVRRRKREMVDSWSSGSRQGLERREGVELVMGHARFTGQREVEISLAEGGRRRIRAERVFINTGGRPRVPEIPGLEGVPFLDSTSVMELGRVPEHLIIVGGGFIGLEFAQMFRRFGAQVTILERSPRLASSEDPEVSEGLEQILRDEGVRVLCGTRVLSVEAGAGGSPVRVRRTPVGSDDGEDPAEEREEEQVTEGSHLMVAAGRVPNTDDLGLDRAGIRTDERGFIAVNERLETGVDGVWALGDVAGSPPFTHFAYDDYRVVRNQLMGSADADTSDRIPTYTVFTDPQLGRVGMTEGEAREAGYDVRVASLPMSKVARAIETGETRGFMKAVVDGADGRILGATILGIEGGEIAAILQVAMMGRVPYAALRDAPISHPTLAESLNNLFMTLD